MDKQAFSLEIKSFSEETGTFTGLASVFGNEDLVGDVVERGAFKRTIEQNPEVPILWQHDAWEPIGKGKVSETYDGLLIEGKLALGVQRGREAHELLKEEALRGLSIGYDTLDFNVQDEVRHLTEVRLWEVSLVTFAANPKAQVLSVKKQQKTVVPFQDLNLAPRDRQWDATAAEKRVRSWAGAEDGPNDKYRTAFLWYDGEAPENFTSYKLLVADVVDGSLVAVPRGIFAAAGVMQGARGGVNIPEGDVEKVKSHLARYYAKMRREWEDEDLTPPWEGESSLPMKFQRKLRQIISESVTQKLDLDHEVKEGRVLSKRNLSLVEAAIEALTKLAEAARREEEEGKRLEAPDGEAVAGALQWDEGLAQMFMGQALPEGHDLRVEYAAGEKGITCSVTADGVNLPEDLGCTKNFHEAGTTAQNWWENWTDTGTASNGDDLSWPTSPPTIYIPEDKSWVYPVVPEEPPFIIEFPIPDGGSPTFIEPDPPAEPEEGKELDGDEDDPYAGVTLTEEEAEALEDFGKSLASLQDEGGDGEAPPDDSSGPTPDDPLLDEMRAFASQLTQQREEE